MPLKGKRLTTFCASLALLHPLLSLTHWIFRSLMLPYKSSPHSANHVRCARQRRVKLKPLKNLRPSGPSTLKPAGLVHKAPATKGGMHFRRPQGGCMVLAAKGGIKNGARKGAHLASAAILYNSRGRSPQPVREASAGPGQNPWRPGPEARRRHQPSPAGRQPSGIPVSADSSQRPITSNDTHSKKALTITVSAF